MWWTRRRARPGRAAPAPRPTSPGDDLAALRSALDRLEQLVHLLERRLDDTEDLAAAALAPDRVDELAARLDEAMLDLATRQELHDVRLHSARVAGDVTRISTELRGRIDRAVAERLALAVDHPTARGTADAGDDTGPWVASA